MISVGSETREFEIFYEASVDFEIPTALGLKKF